MPCGHPVRPPLPGRAPPGGARSPVAATLTGVLNRVDPTVAVVQKAPRAGYSVAVMHPHPCLRGPARHRVRQGRQPTPGRPWQRRRSSSTSVLLRDGSTSLTSSSAVMTSVVVSRFMRPTLPTTSVAPKSRSVAGHPERPCGHAGPLEHMGRRCGQHVRLISHRLGSRHDRVVERRPYRKQCCDAGLTLTSTRPPPQRAARARRHATRPSSLRPRAAACATTWCRRSSPTASFVAASTSVAGSCAGPGSAAGAEKPVGRHIGTTAPRAQFAIGDRRYTYSSDGLIELPGRSRELG